MTTRFRKLRVAVGESMFIWVAVGSLYRIIGISAVALINNRNLQPVGWVIVGGAAVAIAWAFPNPRMHSMTRRVASLGYMVAAMSAGIYALNRWVLPSNRWVSLGGTFLGLAIWVVGMRFWSKKTDFKPFMDHNVLHIEDLGDDLEGEGVEFRLLRVQVLHKHGSTTFIKAHDQHVPKDDDRMVLRMNDDMDDD